MRPALMVVLLVFAGAFLGAEDPGVRLAGLPLGEALRHLGSTGLKVLFSSELVRPDMRVESEPRARDPRKVLEEVLAPHGLAVKPGPGGSLLVVKAASPAEPRGPKRPSSVPAQEARFEELVEVSAPASPGESLLPSLPVAPAQVGATAGALENVFHTLQLLPGVAPPEEFGGRIAVRGGGPDQNLTILDGVEVYNPYRLVGLVSAFNPETVERFELFTGAFSARYGDRLSSLLVIASRDGSQARRLTGSASLSLTDANVVFEGRLPGRCGSWWVTARRTYYDLVAESFIGDDLPSFTDVQGRATCALRPGHRVAVEGFLSWEGTDSSQKDEETGQDFHIFGRTRGALLAGTVDSIFSARARLRTIASLSRHTDDVDVRGRLSSASRRSNTGPSGAGRLADVFFVRTMALRDLALREELTLEVSSRHMIETGLEVHDVESRWGLEVAGDRTNGPPAAGIPLIGLPWGGLPDRLDSSLQGLRAGAWIENRILASSRLTLRPGVRIDRVSSTGETVLSPRLAAMLELGKATRLKAAAGLHSQSPGYEKRFLADAFVDLTAGVESGLRSERAVNAVLGLEHDFSPGVSLRLETYWRRFDRLIVGRLETEAERDARVARYDFPPSLQGEIPAAPSITSFPVNDGRGNASGLELFVSKKAVSSGTGLTGWLSYSLSSATRRAHGLTLPFDYDRRHSVTLVGQLRATPWLELSASAQAASGAPFTPALGVRVASEPDSADLDGDSDRSERIPARDSRGFLIYEPNLGGVDNLNSASRPSFARLDLRATFRPRGPSGRWLIYLDVINALNRRNTVLVVPEIVYNRAGDRPSVRNADGVSFPFLPSLGVRFRF